MTTPKQADMAALVAVDADIAAIAKGLSERQREAWVWTVLAVAATKPQRVAFIDGYNGYDCRKPRTVEKLRYHERGQVVRAHLLESPSHDG